ncbi:MAG: 4'-phosphopantetheinyl transferase superfamily protein [Betaproteobacteria bacterium]|nr:4'-phosphopantetheinyl transferase superfamily protein [Betaproteobacteria bacterium]
MTTPDTESGRPATPETRIPRQSLPLAPSFPPELAADEVHVWRLDLSGDCPEDSGRCRHECDLQRAARFVLERDRKRFLRARYEMRRLLGGYLDIAPVQLVFAFNPHGKPMLDPRFGLGFNFSHSGDLGLLAIGRMLRIGIDIEKTAARPDMRRLAHKAFTPGEVASLAGVGDGELLLSFLTCWTRKEACLKALGMGLALAPESLHVGTDPDRRRIAGSDATGGEFMEVASVIRDDRCVAALAVAGGYSEARIFDRPP